MLGDICKNRVAGRPSSCRSFSVLAQPALRAADAILGLEKARPFDYVDYIETGSLIVRDSTARKAPLHSGVPFGLGKDRVSIFYVPISTRGVRAAYNFIRDCARSLSRID